MERTTEILTSNDNEAFTVKYCASEEEVKNCLNPPPVDCSTFPGGFSFCNQDKANVIISLSDSAKWNEPNNPSPLIEATLTEKLAEWGRNFMYNAKSGNNIWYALLGDKQLDPNKKVRLLNKDYEINTKDGFLEFLTSFKKLIWITYRNQFLPLREEEVDYCDDKEEEVHNKKIYTSDNGWGCTIRVGQMALANGLVRHFTDNGKYDIKKPLYEKIISDFWDNGIGENYPFSIQNFCATEIKYHKQPGQWLGQAMVATILEDLNSMYSHYKLQILIFADGSFYQDQFSIVDSNEIKNKGYELIEPKDIEDVAGKLLFISCSLGIKSPEIENLPRFKELFEFPELVGVMGGRKSEALFFIGYQDDDFLFLDPHFVQVNYF